jgi:hypothetical protein
MPEEQKAKKTRFRARNLNRFNSNTYNSYDFDKRFTKAYLQYVAKFEGEDNTSKDELSDAFKALLADIGKEVKEQPSDSYFTGSYFTLVKSLLIKSLVAPSIVVPYIKTLIVNLNN